MKSRELGMSLVEVMVAVLISTILVLGVTELFGNSFFSSRSNNELTRMQEAGRVALEVIGADARRAGYQGCTAADQEHKFNDGHSLPDDAVTSSSATTVTFRFADPGTGCNDSTGTYQELTWNEPAVTYSSANGTLSRNGDPILDNVNMSVAFIPTGSALTSTAVRITITVSDSRNAAPHTLGNRTFSGTYELRNKLL
ncbi:prepilin-type N-terminal cleavage/methylation domain-containing protein [Pseudomonas benzenivorans]|uniref:Prepilin-type N-terminal cleavage/methylation domain-containing protein n=1 Tax=Pseudomonas benzenivorans TaxID=556533 RepID=A0ABZ0PTB5_9PSED|nr:prepilin-type N-terminal cleavage/methylation domain-containing protein [Pseudomonas benzenivorans]WPC04407.1 prepilin-type N-terminal cleavage/methylation domain-containing protein [Pseudomonas benzenivorans]